MALLEVKNLTKRFGGLTALDNVSFQVEEGEIHGLIGPNGSGKSTMFKNIAGFYRPTSGEVRYGGRNIVGLATHDIARLGVVRTFQETTLFQEMTVWENVRVGCHMLAGVGFFSSLLRLRRAREGDAATRRKAMEVIEFMQLSDQRDQLAAELPLGSQRALALAIALAAEPKLLLMDEPFAGMNPEETARMMELTRKARDAGVTIVLVEHDMKAVVGLCEILTVLNFGRLLTEGPPDEVCRNPDVIEAYLGGAH